MIYTNLEWLFLTTYSSDDEKDSLPVQDHRRVGLRPQPSCRYIFTFLSALFCSRVTLATRVLAAESQLAACKRRIEKKDRPRPRFTQAFRLLWVLLSKAWDQWHQVAHLMQPASTLKRWHTTAFRVPLQTGQPTPEVERSLCRHGLSTSVEGDSFERALLVSPDFRLWSWSPEIPGQLQHRRRTKNPWQNPYIEREYRKEDLPSGVPNESGTRVVDTHRRGHCQIDLPPRADTIPRDPETASASTCLVPRHLTSQPTGCLFFATT